MMSSECREGLISAVPPSEEVEGQGTHEAEQEVLASYHSTVLNLLMLIDLLIVLDKNQSLALTALIVKIDDKEVWKLSDLHAFTPEQKHVADQEIHSHPEILLWGEDLTSHCCDYLSHALHVIGVQKTA